MTAVVHTLARLGIVTLIATILLGMSGRAMGQPGAEFDRHTPAAQDQVILEQVRYSFGEVFAYAIPDTNSSYGTTPQFRSLYPDRYWEENLLHLSNEDGTLAWARSRDMMALATMFDVTGDPWYMSWLRRYVSATLSARDDHSGRRDFDGHLVPGWGSSRYAEGKRRIYLVHTSLIVQPLLEWAVRAPKVPGWSESDESERASVIRACSESLLWHDYQLETEPPAAGSVYRTGREEEDRAFLWQPFNRQNLMARNFHLLFELTGDQDLRQRAERLYRFFKDRLEVTPGGAYVWEYEPMRHAETVKVAACEDVSHASFTIEALAPVFAEGFVFDTGDRDRFARTFMNQIYLGGGVFQSSIGCTATFTRRYMDRMYGWLPLAASDPRIYALLFDFYARNVEIPPPAAIAYLVAMRPDGWSPHLGKARP